MVACVRSAPLSPRERENLIIQHQPDALSAMKKHAPRGIPVEDLRQEAFVALVLAVDTFDPTRGDANKSVEERLVIHIYWLVRGGITALVAREKTQALPYAGRDTNNQAVRNHMVRLDERVRGDPNVPGDEVTRLERLESTGPSPEEVAAHRELMATAKLLLNVTKKDKGSPKKLRRRVAAASGKRLRIDAEVLAVARSM